MAFGNQEAALLFKIKADSSDADRALRGVDSGIAGLGGNLDKLGAIAGTVSGIAAGAIAALGTAAAATAATLFSLARSAADYGSEIKDAADKTGVSTEVLSALKVAADESGSSLEEVANKTVKFSKLVGDAAEGSKQAKESLIRLGVDPQEAMNDLDAALEKVFKRINEAPPGIAQTKLATEAFGKAGANIIPVIKSFDGDMAGLIKRVKEMGLVFDQEAADAADEFGDTLDDLNKTTKGLAMTFAREFLPQVTGAMRSVQRMMQSNTSTAELWGRVVSGALADMQRGFGRLAEWANSDQGQKVFDFMRWQAAILTGGGSEALAELLNKYTFRASGGAQAKEEVGDGGLTNFDDADRRRKEAEASAKKDSAALLNIWKNYAASIVKTYTEAFSKLKEQFDQSGDAEDFQKKLGLLNNLFAQEAEKTVANLNAIENAQAEADKKTANERLLLKQEQAAREEEFAQRVTDTWDEAEKLITARLKKETTEREKLTEERFRRELEMARSNAELAIAWAESDREKGLISEIDFQKRLAIEKESVLQAEKRLLQQREQTAEVLQRLRILENELTIQTLQDVDAISKAVQDLTTAGDTLEGGDSGLPGNDSASGGPFDNWTGSWKGLLTTVLGDAPTLTSALGDIGAMFVRMFEQMAQAIGQVVHQWVLYGETGPAVMRKILASALATIAAESAVKAIESLGWAFFFLATHQYTSAAAAFQAAALFGSIAGATALAGRAIAGDAFKQTAAGGSASSASSGSRGFTGGAYSGSEPMTVNGGRNAPAGAAGAIVVRDRSSGLFSQLFKLEWENNGPMRRMLVEEFG